MAKKKPTDRELEIEAQIKDLVRIAAAAEARKQFNSATLAQSRLSVLRDQLHRLREINRIAGIRDPIKKLQAQQALFTADGSLTAAAKLADTEARLIASLAESESRKAEAELDGMDLDSLVEIIVSAIPNLPAEAKSRIADALGLDFGDGDDSFDPGPTFA